MRAIDDLAHNELIVVWSDKAIQINATSGGLVVRRTDGRPLSATHFEPSAVAVDWDERSLASSRKYAEDTRTPE